jgi:hypothetical protein
MPAMRCILRKSKDRIEGFICDTARIFKSYRQAQALYKQQ